MEYFWQLAKDINRIRHRRCYVFERRFSAEPVLDDIALQDRLLYLVLTPLWPPWSPPRTSGLECSSSPRDSSR